MIPHRRGDDGYFHAAAHAAGGAGDWQRDARARRRAAELLILADTSGSMDVRASGSNQTRSSRRCSPRSAEGHVQPGRCDVKCDWASSRACRRPKNNVAEAQAFLASAHSLGWTDLDKAFAAALKRMRSRHARHLRRRRHRHTGDADPVAFANDCKRLVNGGKAHVPRRRRRQQLTSRRC